MVSFVIPVWNNFHLINQLLCDIRDNCTPDEILVVDDCSPDQGTQDGLQWWADNYGTKVLRPIENLGFLKASNYGLRHAVGDILCLISSDVRIYKDLASMVKGMVAPDEKVLLGGRVFRDSTGWNEFNGKIFPYVEGWLLIARKEHWEQLGYFDERFSPNDFEDVDLSTTALSLGFTLRETIPGTVEHMGAQTIRYTEERRQLTERNRDKFREKWIK